MDAPHRGPGMQRFHAFFEPNNGQTLLFGELIRQLVDWPVRLYQSQTTSRRREDLFVRCATLYPSVAPHFNTCSDVLIHMFTPRLHYRSPLTTSICLPLYFSDSAHSSLNKPFRECSYKRELEFYSYQYCK